MKQIDWLNLNSLRYYALSQFSPCRKAIVEEKIFNAGTEGSFPITETCEYYDVLSPFLCFLYFIGRAANQAQENH